MALREDSCKEVLAMARDGHWWALVAMTLLEDKIERLSHSLSYRHSGSLWWRRSQTAEHQTEVPQVTSHHGDSARRWALSPNPSWPRWWMTFAEGRAPSSLESSPERDTSADEAYKLPPLTWGVRGHWMTNLTGSRPTAEEEGDPKCLPPLEPHLQVLLSGEETFLASAGVEGSFPWTSTPNDPKPSPMEHVEWIKWHAQQPDMPAWWWELQGVTGHEDQQEFAMRIWASFEVPRAQCHALGWTTTTLHHQPTLPWKSINSCCFQTHSLVVRTTNLCESPSTLGRKGQNANPWQALPFGRGCVGALGDDGTPDYLHRWGGLHGSGTLKLGGDLLSQTGGTCSVRLQPKQKLPGPPKGVPISSPQRDSHYHKPLPRQPHEPLWSWRQCCSRQSLTPLPGFVEIAWSLWGNHPL